MKKVRFYKDILLFPFNKAMIEKQVDLIKQDLAIF